MVDSIYSTLTGMVRQGKAVSLATVIAVRSEAGGAEVQDVQDVRAGAKLLIPATGEPVGAIHPAVDEKIARDAAHLLADERSQTITYGLPGGSIEVFIESFPPPQHLVIVGAVHVGIALARLGKMLGYHVTVVDPRQIFANKARFPEADRIIVEWPEEALRSIDLNMSTYVVVLTHDPKLDLPALMVAISSPVRYVGAIGSRTTVAQRKADLIEMGAGEEQVARIHSPVGLNIGARTPAEIAVSIMAEIIAVRRKAGGQTGLTG